jgi:hypothetical protein
MMSRWLDHLPSWLAWAALAGTGIYGGAELGFMALPLLAAASVELHRWDLARWRLSMEIAAVVSLISDVLLFHNVFAAVVHLLCVLSGLRLALPRLARERRQLLLMGFLLFLTTAISTADAMFLFFALLWSLGAMAMLLQMAWEQGAHLRRGLAPRAPFRKLPLWLGSAASIGAFVFVALPRATPGQKHFSFMQRRILGTAAGLGDNLDLAKEGPIQDNDAVALRITPLGQPQAASKEASERDLGLLRGMVLEHVKGMRWEPSLTTPFREGVGLHGELEGGSENEAEFFVAPSRAGIVPIPYGTAWFRQPLPMNLRSGEGGSLRWAYLASTGLPLRVGWRKGDWSLRERNDFMGETRRRFLTALGPEHESAQRLSLSWVPESVEASTLASRLQTALQQRCSYTLENPSGKASNPLSHFLEVSHAGHCEYFASALALMLRARGVPARIAAGYRLGPWIPEGGYFLVSQNQAHAWVEYWDEAHRLWRVADPTPSAAMVAGDAASMGGWSRVADALRYRWDRFVVRFSDQDQQEGLSWMQTHLGKNPETLLKRLGIPLLLLVILAVVWRSRSRMQAWLPAPRTPGGISALRPLVRRVRHEAPPEEGETVRAWLLRLSKLKPHLAHALHSLADAAEAHVYGGRTEAPLKQEVARILSGWDLPT